MLKQLPAKAGFSLLELLIAFVIIGVIVSIAYPSYLSHIRKTRRSDAATALVAMQLAQEKYRATHSSYGDLTQISFSNTSPQGYYTLSIVDPKENSYKIVATATGDQAKDTEGSTSCATLTITVSGLTESKTPADCW